jgi:hypothetical protein
MLRNVGCSTEDDLGCFVGIAPAWERALFAETGPAALSASGCSSLPKKLMKTKTANRQTVTKNIGTRITHVDIGVPKTN